MINLTTVSQALKVLYINPIREFVNMQADPFMSRIEQTSDNIVGYQKIVRAVQIGANGGAGAGTETGVLPVAGENLYKQFESDTKNLYGTISISDKILKSATGASAGSFVNALQRDVDTLVATLKFSMARQGYGDGTGKLGLLTATTATNMTSVTLTGSVSFNVLPGLTIDVYNGSDALISSTSTPTRISDVNHKTGVVKLDTALVGAITTGSYITMQGSKNLELTGLGKVFSTADIYSLTRADYSWMQPYTTTNLGALTEWKLQEVINLQEDTYQSKINHIAAGNAAYGHYMALMNARRTINDTLTLQGGHKALLFNGIPLTRCKFLASDTIDMYDTTVFSMDQISDWEWLDDNVHGILQRNARYATYEGSIAKYCDMMCRLPGAQVRLGGVAEPDVVYTVTGTLVTTTT